MRTLAVQSIEVERERRDERLAFTRLHLGDFALMEDGGADELHVVGALAARTADLLAGGGEGLRQEVVQRFSTV